MLKTTRHFLAIGLGFGMILEPAIGLLPAYRMPAQAIPAGAAFPRETLAPFLISARRGRAPADYRHAWAELIRLEEQLIRDNELLIQGGFFKQQGEVFEFSIDARRRYLRINDLALAVTSLRIPETFASFPFVSMWILEGDSIEWTRFLIPLLGLMQEIEFSGEVVEDLGTGKGILLGLALEMKARFGAGVDHDRESLRMAWRLLSGSQSGSIARFAASSFILSYRNVRRLLSRNRWQEFWQKKKGEFPTIRIAHMGRFFDPAHEDIVTDSLNNPHLQAVILGGYTAGGTEYEGFSVAQRFEAAGWTTVSMQFANAMAFAALRGEKLKQWRARHKDLTAA